MSASGQSSNPASSRRLTPARVAVTYVLFASLWIVASGLLLTFTIADPVVESRIEMLKGLLFVSVTGGLLYLLLKGWHESMGDMASAPANDLHPPKTFHLVLLFAVVTMVAPLIGLAVIKLYGPQIEREAYANLQAVATLKATQIENWMSERNGDSMVLSADKDFAARVARFVHNRHDVGLSAPIQERFDNLRTEYGYGSILLFDTSGKLLLISGKDADNTSVLQQQLRQVVSSGKLRSGDLYRDESGNIHLDWLIPIFSTATQDERPIGLVVLRVTAQKFIFR